MAEVLRYHELKCLWSQSVVDVVRAGGAAPAAEAMAGAIFVSQIN